MKQVTLSAKTQVEQFIEKYIGVTEMLSIDDRLTGLMAGSETVLSSNGNFKEHSAYCRKLWKNIQIFWEEDLAALPRTPFIHRTGDVLDVSLTGRPYFSAASKGTYVTPALYGRSHR